MYFTQQNTEGFSDAKLAQLNTEADLTMVRYLERTEYEGADGELDIDRFREDDSDTYKALLEGVLKKHGAA